MTIDKTRLPRPRPGQPGALPQFTPVPRQTSRHDGWTEERQRRFIEALADTGSVKAAAHRVNMTPEGAYLLRRHPEGQSFRKAWEAALALGVQQLEDIAMERALYGQEVPVYSYGKLIGSRIVHNDRLLMFMLRNRAPTRFTADGRAAGRQTSIGNPLKAAELSRLKKQWRKEWEAESKRERAIRASEQARQSESNLIEGIASMHQRWFTDLGPRTRAAYRQFREIELAEEEELQEARWSHDDIEIAQEDLAQASDPWEEADAREALTAARQSHAAIAAERERAEAEYDEWFNKERRAKVWWVIDVVFGALSRGDVGEEVEGE